MSNLNLEWLSKTRAYYAELESVLDEKVLTLPKLGVQPVYRTTRYGSTRNRLPAWQFHVDERLEWLPSYSKAPSNDLFIEWVYTIDLDREIVEVKSELVESSFKLHSIPQEWADDFEREEENDEEGDEISRRVLIGDPLTALLTPANPSKSLVAKYDSLKVKRVKPRTLDRPVSHGEHIYLLRRLLFSHFVERWSRRMFEHILLCRPTDFIYREVLFAILSLAAGEFKVLADQSPEPAITDGFVRLGSPNGPSILPDFGSGMHFPNTLPGSAPDSSIYWFKGVLILLVDDLSDEDGLKAAIATASESGQGSGPKLFDALVTDIKSFMLLRIEEPGVVQHTDLVELIDDMTLSDPRHVPSDDSEHDEGLTLLRPCTRGFDILMKFFDVVAVYTLQPFRSTTKRLPNELLDRIIESADPDTYVKLSEVSESFRHYVQHHVRILQQPDLTFIPHEDTKFSHHVIKGVSSTSTGWVIISDLDGRDVETKLEPVMNRGAEPRWAPVIGDGNRQSMMIDCAITIPALASYPLPKAEDSPREINDGSFDFVGRMHVEGHFSRIPEFASARDTSLKWESYTRELIKFPWSVDTESHHFLLPPNTAIIRLEHYVHDGTDGRRPTHCEMAGIIWLRKGVDFEVPLLRQRSLREAQEFLANELVRKESRWRLRRQGLLVTAFGSKAQCFRWNFSDDPRDVQPVLTPSGDGAVFDNELEDQREVFRKLFLEWSSEVRPAKEHDGNEGKEDTKSTSAEGKNGEEREADKGVEGGAEPDP